MCLEMRLARWTWEESLHSCTRYLAPAMFAQSGMACPLPALGLAVMTSMTTGLSVYSDTCSTASIEGLELGHLLGRGSFGWVYYGACIPYGMPSHHASSGIAGADALPTTDSPVEEVVMCVGMWDVTNLKSKGHLTFLVFIRLPVQAPGLVPL